MLTEDLEAIPIRLLPLTSRVTESELLKLRPEPTLILACDFYVEGIERTGKRVPGGYQLGHIINVDHHAPTEEMQRPVSSTTLALERVAEMSTPQDALIAVHHTDCDSVLSAGILSGRLKPDPHFNDAAIAADHTGEANPIADLLQALDRKRDLEFSFRNLAALLDRQPLEPEAERLLRDRHQRRRDAAEAVATGRFQKVEGVYFGVFQPKLEGEFFPALLPEAEIILAMEPIAADRWVVKARLGNAAREGLSLDALRIREHDAFWGGRWNAGGNGRPDADGIIWGTNQPPQCYAETIASLLDAYSPPARDIQTEW